jgi:hypothetical protein
VSGLNADPATELHTQTDSKPAEAKPFRSNLLPQKAHKFHKGITLSLLCLLWPCPFRPELVAMILAELLYLRAIHGFNQLPVRSGV